MLADPVRLEQVLGNLLSNAAKYSSSGGSVHVVVEDRGDEVSIVVRDQGSGIDADLLPRIFDPFVQAEQRIDRARGGLGIGLTIVKQLVELHGGTVRAESEGPERGSTFEVRLPTHREPAPDPTEDEPIGAAPARDVLVVDDNRDAADALALLLRDAGHAVRVVYDGPSALQSAAQDLPDVVLLDLGLPGMDGFEVGGALRSRYGRSLVLLALTGYGDQAHRERTAAVGFDAHLVKPMASDALERLMADPARVGAAGDGPEAREEE